MTKRLLALLALLPLGIQAQTPSSDVRALRAKAISEGSVEINVVTRALALSNGASVTPDKKAEIARDQSKLMAQLIARNLVVGNEIWVQPDGSFTLRVLPDAIEYLSASREVSVLQPAPTERLR
jgi:predicted outer membrane protein